MHAPPASPLSRANNVPLGAALRFWLKLGFISFGGPAGQIALMHEHLVERQAWISERRFLHALNYCMLLPGPEAQQLATYLGWLMHRSAGGIAAGVLFILPSFLLITLLAGLYLSWGHLPQVQAVLYGIRPAIVAIVLAAAWRIGSRTLRSPLYAALCAAAFVGIHVLGLAFPWLILGAALIGWAASRRAPVHDPRTPDPKPRLHDSPEPVCASRPALIDDDTPPPAHARPRAGVLIGTALAGLALWAGAWWLCRSLDGLTGDTLTDMAAFFTRAALLTFGGAYAVLPYVHQAAVEHYQWLSAAQMLDALALGETTPGPLIMVLSFVGFVGGWTHEVFGPQRLVLAGTVAASVATFFTFLPSFLFILLGGPLVEATRQTPRLGAALSAVTAAVVGVILSLATSLAQAVVLPAGAARPDLIATAIGLLAVWLLLRGKRSILTVIGVAALAGMLIQWGLAV